MIGVEADRLVGGSLARCSVGATEKRREWSLNAYK